MKIFLITLHKAITELFKLNFKPLFLKITLKQKNKANSLKHRNDFCDWNLKRKIVRIKRYAEKICWLNKKNQYKVNKQRRSLMDKLEELALQVSPEAATGGIS